MKPCQPDVLKRIAEFNEETQRLRRKFGLEGEVKMSNPDRKPTTWPDVGLVTIVCATLVAIVWIIAKAVS